MDASKLNDSPKDKHVHTMYNAAVASVINFYFSNESSEALYQLEHH